VDQESAEVEAGWKFDLIRRVCRANGSCSQEQCQSEHDGVSG